MEMHQKDIQENDPFGQNGDDEADDEDEAEKSFLKALLAERALKNSLFFSYLQFSDLLIYANRTTSPTLHFRVHGQMMLKDVTVLDSEPRLGQEHCFNLYDGKKAVLIAASSHAEKLCWMEDIAEAAQVGRTVLLLNSQA